MFDAKDLLGRLTQTQMTETSKDRLSHAMGAQGPGSPGLGDVLGGLLGGQGGGLGGGAGGPLAGLGGLGGLLSQLGGQRSPGLGGTGGMSGAGGFGGAGGLSDAGGLGGMLEGMLGSAGRSVQSGNPLAVGGLAALAGAMLGGGGGAMKGAVGGGLLAVLGSLAFSALKNKGGAAGGGQPASLDQVPLDQVPLGLREPQEPAEEAELQNTALLVIRAMINAAKADGAIDGGEMGRIMGKLNEEGTDPEARDFVMTELQKPFDLDALAADVTCPEVAVQVYGASLLAIEVDTPAEEDYLKRLAERLGLDAEMVARVHEGLGVKPSA